MGLKGGIWVLMGLSLSGCAHEVIIYKCPPSQVKVIEDRGLPTEREVCYVPGVNYTDVRPISVEKAD